MNTLARLAPLALSLSLHEIAFLVGFSDPSNFHRAFRRWTGTTPAAVRERPRG